MLGEGAACSGVGAEAKRRERASWLRRGRGEGRWRGERRRGLAPSASSGTPPPPRTCGSPSPRVRGRPLRSSGLLLACCPQASLKNFHLQRRSGLVLMQGRTLSCLWRHRLTIGALRNLHRHHARHIRPVGIEGERKRGTQVERREPSGCAARWSS